MGKILVFGYFGYYSNQLDGQTVKTRNIYELLKDSSSNSEIAYFDSEIFKYNKLKIFNLIYLIIFSKKVYYLPASNNLKYIFPFLFFLAKLFNTKLYYIVIGGWLDVFLSKNKFHAFLLKNINQIYPETIIQFNDLKNNWKFKNITLLPNFRIHNYVPKEIKVSNNTLRLVFFARINKLKGYDYIFNFIEKYKNLDLIIDFYGPINKEDELDFKSKINNFENCNYLGELQPNTIYPILNNYDALLFPTRYFTEGFPGSILDAYIAGIPVIATEWMHSKEFVINDSTGFVIPFNDSQNQFDEAIFKIYNDRFLLKQLKINAIEKSKQYSYNNILKILDF